VSTTRATKIAGNKRFRQDSANTLVALAVQLGPDYPTLALPERRSMNTMLEAPLPQQEALGEELVRAQHRLAARFPGAG
jgi:hypothetical protein